MAIKTSAKIALMSIHPQFVQQILNGRKKVEFRKTRFAIDISHVIIYATVPIKKIVGYFEVKNIIEAHPIEIWKRYEEIAGIEFDFFMEYYQARVRAVAIEVGEVRSLASPIPLNSLGIGNHPPQNYQYVEADVFKQIAQ